jgi:Eukaryotic aspartyl protease
MKQQNAIKAQVFAFYLNLVKEPNPSSVMIGGYDQLKIKTGEAI